MRGAYDSHFIGHPWWNFLLLGMVVDPIILHFWEREWTGQTNTFGDLSVSIFQVATSIMEKSTKSGVRRPSPITLSLFETAASPNFFPKIKNGNEKGVEGFWSCRQPLGPRWKTYLATGTADCTTFVFTVIHISIKAELLFLYSSLSTFYRKCWHAVGFFKKQQRCTHSHLSRPKRTRKATDVELQTANQQQRYVVKMWESMSQPNCEVLSPQTSAKIQTPKALPGCKRARWENRDTC